MTVSYAFLGLIVIAIINQGLTLNCLVCNGKDHECIGTELEDSTNSELSKTCPSGVASCMTVGVGPKLTRKCGPEEDDVEKHEGCKSVPINTNICFCYEDNCNTQDPRSSAITQILSVKLALLSVLIAVILQ